MNRILNIIRLLLLIVVLSLNVLFIITNNFVSFGYVLYLFLLLVIVFLIVKDIIKKKIIENLNHSYVSIKTDKVYDYVTNRKSINYTVNEVFQYFDINEIISAQIDTTRILEKYSDSDLTSYYRDVITDSFLVSAYSMDNMKTFTSYQYKINPFAGENEFYSIDNQEIRAAKIGRASCRERV